MARVLTPDQRIRQREYDRRWRQRNRTARCESKKRWYEKLKADPERWARHQAYQRAYKWWWETGLRVDKWSLEKWGLIRARVWAPIRPLPRVEECPPWEFME